LSLSFRFSRWARAVLGLIAAARRFRGVEIHERIMPLLWGLSERDMLAHGRPVDGLDPFYTFSASALA